MDYNLPHYCEENSRDQRLSRLQANIQHPRKARRNFLAPIQDWLQISMVIADAYRMHMTFDPGVTIPVFLSYCISHTRVIFDTVRHVFFVK